MWPVELLRDTAWRPLTWTLLHFLWQGMFVALIWAVLFRLFQARRTQVHYVLGLAGMFVMAACPVVTLVLLESDAGWREAKPGISQVDDRLPLLRGSSASQSHQSLHGSDQAMAHGGEKHYLVRWIGAAQPYVLGGWIVGLTLLGGRVLLGVVGVRRLRRGRRALSGDIADRAAALARRMGLGRIPGMFASVAAREAVVVGLLRPMVLLPVAWLAEMSPDVLEAVIAHELAHIRRFDLWFNLFQRLVETLLFYHPAVWWLSRRVRLAREMCCDELAARTTGDCVAYATALETAARKRITPAGSLLQVALGVTRMTLLDRVRNVLGLGPLHKQRRWWLAVLLVLLVSAAIGLTWMGVTHGNYTATAYLQIHMRALSNPPPVFDRERFEIFTSTQKELLLSRPVLLVALRKPEVARLPEVQQAQRASDAVDWLKKRVSVSFPGKAGFMEVSFRGDDPKAAAVLVNAVVDSYLTDVVKADRDAKRERLNKLENACADKEQQIRDKRGELKSLALINGVGTGPEVITQKQKMIVEEYGLRSHHKASMEFALGDLESQLVAQKALVKSVEAVDADDPDMDALVQKDQMAQTLLHELAIRKVGQLTAEKSAPDSDKSRDAERVQKEIKSLQDEFDKRREQLVTVVQKRKRAALQADVLKLQMQFDVKKAQYDVLAKQVERLGEEAQKFSSTTVDIEMLQSDLKRMELIATELNAERERMRVELSSAPRVTLVEKAEEPDTPSR
jgi:beta-lactamase regulating signal transducer with metallopeptidase domain